MTKCTHCETCEDCHEALRKEKALASLRSGLAGRLNGLLGVQHLKGTPLLDAAVARVEALLKIEKFAAEMVKAEDCVTAQRPALSPIGFADAVEG